MYICGFFSSTFSFYLNCSYIKFISAGCSRITLFWTTNSPFFSLVKKITGEKCQICQLGVYISTQLVMYAYICMYVQTMNMCVYLYTYILWVHMGTKHVYMCLYISTHIYLYTHNTVVIRPHIFPFLLSSMRLQEKQQIQHLEQKACDNQHRKTDQSSIFPCF